MERSKWVTQLSHTGVTQRSHTGVTGNAAVTCRGHRGSHSCHMHGSQEVAQLLHGEVTGGHIEGGKYSKFRLISLRLIEHSRVATDFLGTGRLHSKQ